MTSMTRSRIQSSTRQEDSMGGIRPPPPVADHLHEVIMQILGGRKIPKRERTTTEQTAYRKICKHKYTLYNMINPIKGDHYTPELTFNGRILPKASDVGKIVLYFNKEYIGEVGGWLFGSQPIQDLLNLPNKPGSR